MPVAWSVFSIPVASRHTHFEMSLQSIVALTVKRSNAHACEVSAKRVALALSMYAESHKGCSEAMDQCRRFAGIADNIRSG